MARAQTDITIGATTAPDASAALDVISTTKGALLPRVAPATGVATPATGLIVFQTTALASYYYNAGTPSWQLTSSAAEPLGRAVPMPTPTGVWARAALAASSRAAASQGVQGVRSFFIEQKMKGEGYKKMPPAHGRRHSQN